MWFGSSNDQVSVSPVSKSLIKLYLITQPVSPFQHIKYPYAPETLSLDDPKPLHPKLHRGYVGRRAAASPATGYPKLHNAEQEALVKAGSWASASGVLIIRILLSWVLYWGSRIFGNSHITERPNFHATSGVQGLGPSDGGAL